MSDIFTEDFLSSLPESPALALRDMFVRFDKRYNSHLIGHDTMSAEQSLEAYHFAKAFILEYGLPVSLVEDMFGFEEGALVADYVFDWFKANSSIVYDLALKQLSEDVEVRANDTAARFFARRRGELMVYEFSDSSFSRIQELLNELRTEVTSNVHLQEDHRRRLISRLEKLQRELHKKTSDVDRVWGLVGEAGVVLGKLGNDAKPIVDRIRELADVVWKAVATAEKLELGTPFQLPGPKD